MKTYAIIPSRYGSSRFPGKPLAMLAGKPLVAWVVEAVKKARGFDEVLVATDDRRIADAVEEHGGKAVMTPSDLPSGTDRIACAARVFLGGDFGDDDILVPGRSSRPEDPRTPHCCSRRDRRRNRRHRTHTFSFSSLLCFVQRATRSFNTSASTPPAANAPSNSSFVG